MSFSPSHSAPVCALCFPIAHPGALCVFLHKPRNQESLDEPDNLCFSPSHSAPGCAMCFPIAHPGALWEFEKRRLSGSSALLPSFQLSWFLGLCKKTQSAPGCAMGKHKAHQRLSGALLPSFQLSLDCVRKRRAHPDALWEKTKRTWVRYGRVRNKGYRVHQRCCQALSFPGSLVCVRKRIAHPGALWENTQRTWVRYGRVRNKGYRVHQRCCPVFSFPGSLACVRKRKAHPGALWENTTRTLVRYGRVRNISPVAQLSAFWFRLCKKTHPGALWENTKHPGALYESLRNEGYRVRQRCCPAFNFPGSLACVRKRKARPDAAMGKHKACVKKTQSAPGCAMGKHKAHLGALWEGEKQRLPGSSALLPSFERSWFLGLCEKIQSAPGCAMGG